MSNRNYEREYDRIAASRMRSTNGGFPIHIALGQPEAIRFRYKLKRMGAKADEILALIDELSYQKTLLNQSLGVRFSSVKRPQSKSKVWNPRSK